jgi:DNA-binding NtrC family response regulator
MVTVPIGLPLAEVERKMIVATLKQCHGDKRRTADLLQVSLKTIYNKLNLYEAVDPLSAPE